MVQKLKVLQSPNPIHVVEMSDVHRLKRSSPQRKPFFPESVIDRQYSLDPLEQVSHKGSKVTGNDGVQLERKNEDLLGRMKTIETEVSKTSSFLMSMHSWALRTSKSLRATEERWSNVCNEVSRLRFEVAQLSAQQEATNLELQKLKKEMEGSVSGISRPSKRLCRLNTLNNKAGDNSSLGEDQGLQSETSGN